MKGAKNIYGLIDWDLKNKPKDNLIILGLGKRYAIENYLLEPHLLGLLLLRKNIVKPTEIGLSGNTYIDICKVLNEHSLQKIANYVQEKINWKNEGETRNSELCNGFVLEIRKEYFTMQGHELETLCVNTWKKLGAIKRGDDSKLKMYLINNVIHEHSDLLSKDIMDTFQAFK